MKGKLTERKEGQTDRVTDRQTAPVLSLLQETLDSTSNRTVQVVC